MLILISTGCIVVGMPFIPKDWSTVVTAGEGVCPDLDGTFAVSGQKSGMAALIWWILPVWWSSNSESIARLDRDLGLHFRRGEPVEIGNAATIRLDHRDPEHLDIQVLRDDGRRVDGVGGMTFARVSRKLEDRARDFECDEGLIMFGFPEDQGEAPPRGYRVGMGRASDGALLVKASSSEMAPSIAIFVPSTTTTESTPSCRIPR